MSNIDEDIMDHIAHRLRRNIKNSAASNMKKKLHKSIYNNRGRAPNSMRNIDSNVSAMDIVQALNNADFNINESRLIAKAYKGFKKNHTEKPIEKRKNLKLCLKCHRRKLEDDDLGEQGSESSMSGDDCRYTRTFHNSKKSGPNYTKMNIKHIKSFISDSNKYRDSTETLKQTKLQNIFTHTNTSVTRKKNDTIIHQNQKCNSLSQNVLCDANVLDLHQKIVPPGQINVTTASSREINTTNDNDIRHDTSVISTCNTGDNNDTLSDNEKFEVASRSLDERPKLVQQAVENVKNPVYLLKSNKPEIGTTSKVTPQNVLLAEEIQSEIEANKLKCSNKKIIDNFVKSFWNTDFETDTEVTPFKSGECVACNSTTTNVVNTKKIITLESKNKNIFGKNSENKEGSQTNKNLNKDTKSKECKPMQKDSESKLKKENIKAKSVQTTKKAQKAKATKKENLRLKEEK